MLVCFERTVLRSGSRACVCVGRRTRLVITRKGRARTLRRLRLRRDAPGAADQRPSLLSMSFSKFNITI